MALTPTDLKKIQVKIGQVFAADGRTLLHRTPEPMTAKHMFGAQSATTSEIIRNGTCVGVEVGYLIDDVTAIPTATTSPATPDCLLSGGDALSSNFKEYNPNLYIPKRIIVNDKDCDNTMKFREKVAHNMATAMHLMARSLNFEVIDFLTTNKQTPTFAGKGGTINVDVIEYPTADFENPDTLADWAEIAIMHDFSTQAIYLDGSNWFQTMFNANFRQLNDNERSDIVALQNGDKISFDVRNLNTQLGTNTTFMVDPHMVAFANRSTYPDTPTPMGDTNNTVRFRVPLQYISKNQDPDKRVETLTYMDGGQMKNIWIDIDHQVVCNAATADGGRASFDHIFDMKIEAMLDLAPATSGTGIIQINRV